MPAMFSSPPKPKQQQQPPAVVPDNTDEATQKQQAETLKKLRGAGRGGQTVLTSATGVSQPGYTASKTLLGA